MGLPRVAWSFAKSDQLLEEDGLPVWPVPGEVELLALQGICSMFGLQLVEARSPRLAAVRALATASSERVTASSSGVAVLAKLYAHLTLRTFGGVSSTFGNVHVTQLDELTPDSVRNFLRRNPACGLIAAPDAVSLRRRVLMCAAAAFAAEFAVSETSCSIREPCWVDIWPLIEVDTLETEGRTIFGAQAPPWRIRSALAAGKSLLTISTHSDGMDAALVADLTLCGLREVDLPPRESPLCRLTGRCHRQHAPITQAAETGRIVPANQIRARILVLDVCAGLMFGDGVISPAEGVLAAILADAQVGAVLTTFSILISDWQRLQTLAAGLAEGNSVGEALSRTAPGVPGASELILFGDPRTQAGMATKMPLGPSLSQSRSTKTTGAKWVTLNPESANLTFLHRLLAPPQASTGMTWENASIALGEFIAGRNTLFVQDWLRWPHERAVVAQLPCHHCRNSVDVIRAKFIDPSLCDRRLKLCPICGVAEDSPEGSESFFEIRARRIRLSGWEPPELWAGWIHAAQPGSAELRAYRWPMTCDGRPADESPLPEDLPLGPFRLSVVLASPSETCVLGTYWRKERITKLIRQRRCRTHVA